MDDTPAAHSAVTAAGPTVAVRAVRRDGLVPADRQAVGLGLFDAFVCRPEAPPAAAAGVDPADVR